MVDVSLATNYSILVLMRITVWINELLPVQFRSICRNFVDQLPCRRFAVRVLLALDKLTDKEKSFNE